MPNWLALVPRTAPPLEACGPGSPVVFGEQSGMMPFPPSPGRPSYVLPFLPAFPLVFWSHWAATPLPPCAPVQVPYPPAAPLPPAPPAPQCNICAGAPVAKANGTMTASMNTTSDPAATRIRIMAANLFSVGNGEMNGWRLGGDAPPNSRLRGDLFVELGPEVAGHHESHALSEVHRVIGDALKMAADERDLDGALDGTLVGILRTQDVAQELLLQVHHPVVPVAQRAGAL